MGPNQRGPPRYADKAKSWRMRPSQRRRWARKTSDHTQTFEEFQRAAVERSTAARLLEGGKWTDGSHARDGRLDASSRLRRIDRPRCAPRLIGRFWTLSRSGRALEMRRQSRKKGKRAGHRSVRPSLETHRRGANVRAKGGIARTADEARNDHATKLVAGFSWTAHTASRGDAARALIRASKLFALVISAVIGQPAQDRTGPNEEGLSGSWGERRSGNGRCRSRT